MIYKIRKGVPEVERILNDMESRYAEKTLDGDELKRFRKIIKTLKLLADNPKHPGMNSHPINELSEKYEDLGKVFESYLENNTPAAGRLFWCYGPGKGEITILGIEPHPEDSKRGAYKKIKLSGMPHNE